MAVITISRQLGSNGNTVAQILCERLGFRYFDKGLMLGLAAQAGVSPEDVVDLSDEKHRARSLIERLFGGYAAPMSDPATWAAGAEAAAQEQLIGKHFRQMIRAAYDADNVVVVGRGGQVALRDKPDVLHVRVVAPLELRIHRQAQRAGITASAAREQVLARDRASADFVRVYYDTDPADPALYDLIINTARISPAAAADLVIAALATLPLRA